MSKQKEREEAVVHGDAAIRAMCEEVAAHVTGSKKAGAGISAFAISMGPNGLVMESSADAKK